MGSGKEVRVGDQRYIVCRNEAEAEKDRSERQTIIAELANQLRKGDKTLIGNSAYRRYLRRVRRADGKPEPAFEIDAGKPAEEARYDGIFVLRTNARLTPLQAVLRYRDLLQVEDLFRRAKAILRTRPIYYCSDAARQLDPRQQPENTDSRSAPVGTRHDRRTVDATAISGGRPIGRSVDSLNDFPKPARTPHNRYAAKEW